MEDSLFWLTVTEGQDSIMAGRHSSKQHTWGQEQEAERSYLQTQAGAENQLAGNGTRLLTLRDLLQWHSSFSRPCSSTFPTAPPVGDQVFRYLSLWETFSFQPLRCGWEKRERGAKRKKKERQKRKEKQEKPSKTSKQRTWTFWSFL